MDAPIIILSPQTRNSWSELFIVISLRLSDEFLHAAEKIVMIHLNYRMTCMNLYSNFLSLDGLRIEGVSKDTTGRTKNELQCNHAFEPERNACRELAFARSTRKKTTFKFKHPKRLGLLPLPHLPIFPRHIPTQPTQAQVLKTRKP